MRIGDAAIGALRRLNLDPDRVRNGVGHMLRPGKSMKSIGELPYTSHGKKALEHAFEAARGMGDDFVGTEHVLLGVLRLENGVAAVVLVGMGVTEHGLIEAIRAERAGAPRSSDRSGAAHAAAATVWFLEIDADSSTPIYEQIIARIEEAVATGRLDAGERLPPVRDLAEELGVAPGTVARAYGALERKGVLETEGARGTRVATTARQASGRSGPDATSALVELLRPVAVAAFHMSVGAKQVRDALEVAMRDIFPAQ